MTFVIAHRGASAYEPENSLSAFRRAVQMTADGVELDVHETADGELVVVHDDAIGGKPIASQSLAQVRGHSLENGEPIPTLPDALDAIGSSTIAFIEVKALSATGDRRLFDVIDAAPAPSNCRVHSFDHRIIRRLCGARPGLAGGVLSPSYPLDPVEQIRAAGAVALWQHRDMIDLPLTAMVHDAGYEVYAWTVDDRARMARLIADGTDALCTNRPDVARELVG